MSDLQPTQDLNMSDAQAQAESTNQEGSVSMAEQQVHPMAEQQVHSKPLSRGYSIKGLAEPGQFDDEQPAFPGINMNENMQLGFKNAFNDMIDHFEKGQSEAAEGLAFELISWARLPVLHRVYSHVVSCL
jgi:hypothetical protein